MGAVDFFIEWGCVMDFTYDMGSENTPLGAVLEVPSLVQAALSKAGVYTVGDCAKWSSGRVQEIRGCGKKKIAIIQELADASEKLLDGDVSVSVEGLTAVPLP